MNTVFSTAHSTAFRIKDNLCLPRSAAIKIPSWQNGTRCRDVNLFVVSFVWLVFKGSIPTCSCFHSEKFFVTSVIMEMCPHKLQPVQQAIKQQNFPRRFANSYGLCKYQATQMMAPFTLFLIAWTYSTYPLLPHLPILSFLSLLSLFPSSSPPPSPPSALSLSLSLSLSEVSLNFTSTTCPIIIYDLMCSFWT